MTIFGDKQGFSEAESARLCWQIMETNFIPMAAFNGEVFVACNQAFLDLIGYEKEEIEEGINWKNLTPPEHYPKDVACVDEIQDRVIPTPYEKEYFRKDGSKVRFIHHNTVVAPGSVKGIAIFVPI